MTMRLGLRGVCAGDAEAKRSRQEAKQNAIIFITGLPETWFLEKKNEDRN
jgi:hypothetical protein